MKVLVTGATGFLGGALARSLASKGHDVVALGRDQTKLTELANLGIDVVRMDLSAPSSTTMESIGSLDALVHCAALSAPWGAKAAFYAANVTGTQTTLGLAQTLGVKRFINISSPTLYFSLKDQENVKETMHLPRPINAYAATKAEAERLVMACQSVGPITLRPRGIYGKGETTLLPRLVAAAQHGPLPLLRDGVAAIDLTHESDVVAAIEAALSAGPDIAGEIFNVSGGEQISVREIVERVASHVQIAVSWRAMPLRPLLAAAHAMNAISRAVPGAREPRVTPYALGLFAYRQSLDISKAQRILKWTPKVSFSKGLEMTFA